LRLAAAIYWYSQAKISQEKAAQIAGLDRADFLAALARENADAFVVDFEDLEREIIMSSTAVVSASPLM